MSSVFDGRKPSLLQGLAIVPVAVVTAVENQPVRLQPEQILGEERQAALPGSFFGLRGAGARIEPSRDRHRHHPVDEHLAARLFLLFEVHLAPAAQQQ
ncbi:hypothetical protein [Amycolatopsis lexingtonensis]|uniref:hypothetical protein n=1 Tax=Amycolatopsis lexingtonensis TaxID=218822 RepID=UPI003F70E845